MILVFMRLIARGTVKSFWETHPEAETSLKRWVASIEEGDWATMMEIQDGFAKAKVLNGERVRFDIAGGDYRLIAAFKFKNRIVFVKFIGSHAEYDRVDALTVALY